MTPWGRGVFPKCKHSGLCFASVLLSIVFFRDFVGPWASDYADLPASCRVEQGPPAKRRRSGALAMGRGVV